MCGITGLISSQSVAEHQIDKMNNCIMHRGPDDDGIFVRGNIGLGQRRLSIIDLEGGKQPISNKDGSVWIVFNGEIYNYKELKSKLIHKYAFKTNSDTEVLLHLYEEKGEKCLQELRGMFAFAIYDFNEKKLFAARDHLGQKPFYYYHEDGKFAFASEIKAILSLDDNLRKLDAEALYEYLTVRIITPPRSMFKGIRKLPPAHYLVLQNNKLSIKKYWDLKFEPKYSWNFNETLKKLDNEIEETVKYHLVSDVPVGAFLSGGMDSSLVVAMMSKFYDTSFKTFAGDVPYKDYSEISYARLVSQRYNTDNHELRFTPSLVKTLPDIVWHLDEPSDSLCVAMYYISELAKKEVKVVLGGDGGDELFGGYDRYYGNVYASIYALVPELIRNKIFGKLLKFLPEGFWYQSTSHKLNWIHQISSFKNGERYAKSLSYFYFSGEISKNLLTEKFLSEVNYFDPEASIKNYFNSENANELIDKMLHSDSMIRMPDHPVMILDRMAMAHGLEARSPFLDHKLAEFSAKIPPKFKIKGRKRRYIQTELARKYLPSELIDRKKQGFASPINYLLENEFKYLFNKFLSNSRLVEEGYLNQTTINTLLTEHLEKRKDHGQRLWLLTNSEIWYRMNIDNVSKNEMHNYLEKM